MDVRSIGNRICQLAECPIWNCAEQALYWTDIPQKRIWRYDPAGESFEIAWEGERIVGGYAFTARGDIVLCTDKGVYYLSRGGEVPELKLLFDIPMVEDERFNDITTDPAGRIFAGTLTERREEGKLYRLEKGRDPVVVLEDIGTSNGMTFSLDEKYFYHTDSHVRTIRRYDYDAGTGEIGNPVVIFKGDEEWKPDGITMDSEGYIWAACWRGGKVIRIDGDGKIVKELNVPAKLISSVMFGGNKLDELYITTASEGAADTIRGLDAEGNLLGGYVYRAKMDVRGRAEWLADFEEPE
jgi:D-xylonolactonase